VIFLETKAHKFLKEQAKKWLKSIGCKKIITEKAVLIDGCRFIIDVVGITNDGKKVAVECGHTPIRKVVILKKCFDIVRIFRYSRKINPLNLSDLYKEKIKRTKKRRRFPIKTKVYANGRTQIPAEIREDLNIKDGDEIVWVKNDHYYILKVE